MIRIPGLDVDSAAALKLDLFCKGLRVEDADRVDVDGRPIRRTRAGMASGVALVLPGGLHVNAPAAEPWTQRSPYRLMSVSGRLAIRWNDHEVCPVARPRRPAFYGAVTRNGTPMDRVAVLQGTYLAVYVGQICRNWLDDPRRNCKFCSVHLNLGQTEEVTKRVEDVVEVALRARDEEGVTFVHLNTGYQDGPALDGVEPYVRALRERTGLLIGVQAPPDKDLARYDALRRLGVNNVSFCLEFWDEEQLRRICPGKHARSGRQAFLDAIRHCATMFDTTNGEIIAGLEPSERTIEAIDWITGVGAIPTVCVFRPLIGTDYADVPPPEYAVMKPIFAHLWKACMRRSLPIGIAPNVKVGIVMLPDECRTLSARPGAFPLKRAKLAAMRTAFGLIFRRRVARARRASPDTAAFSSAPDGKGGPP